MEKPRVKYADFMAEKQAKERPGTIAWIIYRYIAEMNGVDGHPVRPLGLTHEYALKRLAKESIAMKKAATLTKQDVIEYAKERHKKVCAATVGQDMAYLTGPLKYAGAAWDGCEEVSDAAITAAKPFLTKHGLIGKSTPRDRRPTQEELDRLLAYFGDSYMATITRWQIASTRRISETCRLLWEDWDRDAHTILVRKMKDPKNKNKRKVVALPEEAQAMLVQMWEKRDQAEPRIFPYRSATCSARYTAAKKELGIENLRLHDCRREGTSRLVEQGYTLPQVILATGHETTVMADRVYTKLKPESFKNGPLARGIA